MELTLNKKQDGQPLIVLLDKIMENAPYKTLVFKLGKPVDVPDDVGHAVLREFHGLFEKPSATPIKKQKAMVEYKNKSLDIKNIVDAEFP